jgi:hypothetical protein
MMRRFSIAALVVSLSAGPAFAQSPSPGPIRRSVEAVRFQDQADDESGITPAFKWTGIGLLIGGGSSMLTAATIDDESCDDFDDDVDCDDVRTGLVIFGAVTAATGAALLFIGKARADRKKASAEILPTRRGVLMRTRLSF